jgi:hypothetical protein
MKKKRLTIIIKKLIDNKWEFELPEYLLKMINKNFPKSNISDDSFEFEGVPIWLFELIYLVQLINKIKNILFFAAIIILFLIRCI